jgi:hypothetical protein
MHELMYVNGTLGELDVPAGALADIVILTCFSRWRLTGSGLKTEMRRRKQGKPRIACH